MMSSGKDEVVFLVSMPFTKFPRNGRRHVRVTNIYKYME